MAVFSAGSEATRITSESFLTLANSIRGARSVSRTSTITRLESVGLRTLDVTAINTPKSIVTGTCSVVTCSRVGTIVRATFLRTKTLLSPGILAVTLVLLGLGIGSTYSVTVTRGRSLAYRFLTRVTTRKICPSLSADTLSVQTSIVLSFAQLGAFLHAAIVRFPTRRALTLEILANSMRAAIICTDC